MLIRIVKNQLAGIGLVRKIKDALSPNPEQYADPKYNLQVVLTHLKALRKHGAGPLDQWRILELGPGGNIGNGIILCAAGAAHVCCVDNYRHVDFQRQLFTFYEELIALLKKDQALIAHFPELSAEQIARNIDACVSLKNGSCEFKPERISYLAPCDAASVPLKAGECDWVFSQAVMEHVKDPEGVCRENARLLKPGGFVSHQIDLRDHFQMDSLEMLKHSGRTWAWMASNSHGFVNRARAAHFEEFYRKAGLGVLQSDATQRITDPKKIPSHPDARFSVLTPEQLSIVGLFILGKKV